MGDNTMALFNKKRKPIFSDLPKPKFDLPKIFDNKENTFPEYKSIIPDFSSIKSEIKKPQQDIPIFDDFEEEPKTQEQKPQQPQLQPIAHEAHDTDLFVKVDKYEQAIRILENIKDSFRRTEDILKNLQTIKQKEEKEITDWNLQIQKLKEKVVSVDSILFESKKR